MLCTSSWDRQQYLLLLPNMTWAYASCSAWPLLLRGCVDSCVRPLHYIEVCWEINSRWILLVEDMPWKHHRSISYLHLTEDIVHAGQLSFRRRICIFGCVRTLDSSIAWGRSKCVWKSRRWMSHSIGILRTLSSELDPTHLSGLRPRGYCLHLFLLEKIVDVVCKIVKL